MRSLGSSSPDTQQLEVKRPNMCWVTAKRSAWYLPRGVTLCSSDKCELFCQPSRLFAASSSDQLAFLMPWRYWKQAW